MKHALTLQTSCSPAVARDRLIQYYTGIGYRCEKKDNVLTFRRGSWLVTFSPRSWQVTVTATVAPVPSRPNDVLISYDVNTTGQLLPPQAMDFWDGEIEAMEEAVRSGTFDRTANKQAARAARGGGWIALARLLLVVIVTLVIGSAVMLFTVYLGFKARALSPVIGADGVGLVVVALFLVFTAGMLLFPLPQIIARTEPPVQSVVQRIFWALLILLGLTMVGMIYDLRAGHAFVIYAVAAAGIATIVWLWFRRWVEGILSSPSENQTARQDSRHDQTPVTPASSHEAPPGTVPRRSTTFIPGHILSALVDALSSLYPRPDEAAAVAELAGLRPWQIDFGGRASSTWVGILCEARNQGRMDVLLAQVQAQHPDSAALAEAIQAWIDWVSSGYPRPLLPCLSLTPAQCNIPWRLIEVLARLYPLPGEAGMMAMMADLHPGEIAVGSVAGKDWLNVLLEAESQERVGVILSRAQAQYPDDAELAEACRDYFEWVAAGRPEPQPALRPLWATDEPQIFLTPAQGDRLSSHLDALARRCPLPADIAAVAIAAGCCAAAIRFAGTTGLVWESVLCESERQGCTDVVLATAMAHHPDTVQPGSTRQTSDRRATMVRPEPQPSARPERASDHHAVSVTAPWRDAHTGLRDALARLYPLPADAAAIALTCGLDPARINFGSCGASIWTSILLEARLRGLTGTLIEYAQAQHPDDAGLADAVGMAA